MNFNIGLLVFCLMLFTCSCKTENEIKAKKLNEFITEFSYDYNSLSSVLVITEEGCPACNRSFANLVKKHLSNSETLCIVSANGSLVDLSPFLDAERAIIDLEGKFKKLKIAEGYSYTIFLQEGGEIDTIIPIRAKTLKADFNYIASRLE